MNQNWLIILKTNFIKEYKINLKQKIKTKKNFFLNKFYNKQDVTVEIIIII